MSSECGAVIKLDGTTGRELWQAADPAYAGTPAVDAAGDVLLPGSDMSGLPGQAPAMVKLDGASGAELWRTVIAVGEKHYGTLAVDVDAWGNFLAVSNVQRVSPNSRHTLPTEVTKLAGVTGEVLWHRVVHDGRGDFPAADVVTDAAGNVFVAGGDGVDFAVFKFAAADGTTLWHREIRRPVDYPPGWWPTTRLAGAAAIVLGAGGRVVLAGATTTVGTGNDFTVVSWTPCEAGSGTACDDGSMPGDDGCSGDCPIGEPGRNAERRRGRRVVKTVVGLHFGFELVGAKRAALWRVLPVPQTIGSRNPSAIRPIPWRGEVPPNISTMKYGPSGTPQTPSVSLMVSDGGGQRNHRSLITFPAVHPGAQPPAWCTPLRPQRVKAHSHVADRDGTPRDVSRRFLGRLCSCLDAEGARATVTWL